MPGTFYNPYWSILTSDQLSDSDDEQLPPSVPPPPAGVAPQYTQINITNPPPAAWSNLSRQQTESLLLKVLDLARDQDERRFQLAREHLAAGNRIKMWALVVGALIVPLGLGAVVYLSSTGHDTAAVGILASLATLVGVFVGKKAL